MVLSGDGIGFRAQVRESGPQHNCLDGKAALRMWTENVTWFSNEEGEKGRIEVGQLADLTIRDRDY
jgi:predicted amidohydrolase YtcJ